MRFRMKVGELDVFLLDRLQRIVPAHINTQNYLRFNNINNVITCHKKVSLSPQSGALI